MARKGPRVLVKLRSTESSHMYLSEKNRRNDTQRLELKKYDPTLRRHVIYRETK
ncbi:MAG: 50S ribosomal protein L33 [Caldilineaceae bacterium]|nr:50S ribosomal protein L33 [Caldilineaceae bacterium]